MKLREICDWLRQNDVAKVRWPERLELIDTMPVTRTRKIIKGLLRARLGNNDALHSRHAARRIDATGELNSITSPFPAQQRALLSVGNPRHCRLRKQHEARD